MPTFQIIVSDVLDGLRSLPDGSVRCCVTSPPYWGLRDYGHAGQIGLERTPEEYVAKLVEVFREVRRVLAEDGTVWLNLGDSYGGERTTGRNDSVRQGKPTGGNFEAGPRTKVASSLRPKDLVGIPWRVAFALQADGWRLRQDIIWSKCISGGAVVYARTENGETPMTVKDMVRLDPSTVHLWDGQRWNQAVAWEPSPAKGDGLEIELRNGQRIGCTPEHRWPTSRGLMAASDMRVGDVLDACRLPAPETPRNPAGLPDEEIGWFVGLYIAEGSQSDGTIQIASHASQTDRFARVRRLVTAYDGHAAMHLTGGNSATINVNSPILLGVIDAYVSGRTAHDKHLGPRCWKRGDAFLRSVLDGYLSGDGHLREGGRWVLGFCNNDALASDLRVVGARIGASVRLRRTLHAMGDRKFPGWRGSLYLNPEQRKRSDYEVVAIRRSRARMFWDISLADDPHTFALGCGVLTHNSNPMPESVTDRCTKAHEYVFLLAKAARYYYDAGAVRDGDAVYTRKGTSGGHKLTHQEGYKGIAGGALKRDPSEPYGFARDITTIGRNRRSVWQIATQPFPGAHFAVMPEALVEPCILAGSAVGDTVLDPFAGSGTVGVVALRHGRHFIGCELNPTYADMARDRVVSGCRLFAEEITPDQQEKISG